MLDLHVHVLPGIDDGPRTLEDALALAQALSDDGIEHIVATPHIYPGVFDNSAIRIGETFDAFQAAVSDAGIDLTMTWAAEVRICPEILEWIELRRLPMLNGSLVGPSTALIELPDGQIPVGTDKLMGMMLDKGITPLMAHPERNKAVMEQATRLEALRRLGCKFQVTAGSLLGDFGPRAQTTARKLLDADWVDVIATDSHNRSGRRPRMRAARDWLVEHFDEALATRLTKTQPTEIAGLTSFMVNTGTQRLVFRDLPMPAPQESADQWSANFVLGADMLQRDTEPTVQADADTTAWTLIDFRIDGVVNELQRTSSRNDLFADEAPPLHSALTAHESSEESENWQLPAFRSDTQKPLMPKAPEAEPVPTQAKPPLCKVPDPMPVVERTLTDRPLLTKTHAEAGGAAVVQEQTAAVPIRLDASSAAPQSPQPIAPALADPLVPRGLRLNQVSTRHAAAIAVDALHPRPAPISRAVPLAQAGNQASSLAAIARSITAAAKIEAAEPAKRTSNPVDPRQGLRLSDLNPLPSRRR